MPLLDSIREFVSLNYELRNLYQDLIDEQQGFQKADSADIQYLLEEIKADPQLGQAGRAFLRGYLNYHFREVMQPLDREAEFRTAVALAPDDHQSNLHLGYETFDFGKYAMALTQFQKINLELHFLWSQIKIRELIVSCHLHLQQFEAAESLLFPLLQLSAEVKDDDYAYPTELLRALAQWHVEFRTAIGEPAWQRLIELLSLVIKKHDLNGVFQDELSQIIQDAPTAPPGFSD